jgi:hypothetical protein
LCGALKHHLGTKAQQGFQVTRYFGLCGTRSLESIRVKDLMNLLARVSVR